MAVPPAFTDSAVVHFVDRIEGGAAGRAGGNVLRAFHIQQGSGGAKGASARAQWRRAGRRIYMAPQSALERLSTTHSELASGTLNERRDIWKAGLQIWNENPVMGIGAGAFQEAVRPLFGVPQAAHNLFVAVLAELGIIGCVLFAGSMVACAVTSFKLPPMERRLAFAVLATLVIGVMGLEWEWREPAWFMLALCCGWSASGPWYRLVFRPAVRRP